MSAGTLAPKSRSIDRIAGSIDIVRHGMIVGWAAVVGSPKRLDVELLIDGLATVRAPADEARADLGRKGIGDGRHGFRLLVPPVFLDGREHEVAVRVAGTEFCLAAKPPSQVLGAPPPPARPATADLPAPQIHRAIEVSVIMPTYNRSALMEATVQRHLRAAERLNAEVIVIDDGSKDDTQTCLRRLAQGARNLVTDRVANGGPARARNLAASMARGSVLVFVGDDVVPVDDDFLAIHASAHSRLKQLGEVVLGKISWPNASDIAVNFVMSHIQGEGEEQFGFRSLKAYQWYGWNMFYSSNISVKKALVRDWMTDGYDGSFYLAAFEDPEFALRTSLRLAKGGEKFGVFYLPAATVVHHHPYTVAGFLSRQVSAGMMAQRFLDLHPTYAGALGLADLIDRLATPHEQTPFPVEHYFSVFEGLKSWALVIENHYGLGHQNWHGDLLKTVFRLAYFEGFLRVQSGPGINLAAGCRYVLETMRTLMNRAIASEVLGDLPGFGLV